jgi:hypothetical protein
MSTTLLANFVERHWTTPPAGADLRRPFIHGYDVREDPPEDVSESVAAGWAWASGGSVASRPFMCAVDCRFGLYTLGLESTARRVVLSLSHRRR